ncbi:Multidrug efflux system ATP-binding protein [Candidatus Magnetaquicoccaceae bacterium FCR-1]|uniref:Multidrug efflux system ATP-binding protein n=1 Tax=Candidatus Magnetaquiglobus chichijimensis TaxID=3141448 RepID=A0ABQ0C9P2_9PROT
MTSHAIDIHAVRKRFSATPVLDGLTLAVPEGKIFALIGGNGAGKSTLIKAILDLDPPDAGEIRLHGVSSRLPAARRSVAYLPERFSPPDALRVGEFLSWFKRLHGAPDDPASTRATLEGLALDPAILGTPIRALSKGMTQKLGLATILMSRKPLWILDEPFSGIDPKARALLESHWRAARVQGVTLFFTTHQLADVEKLCDALAILHGGTTLFTGTPRACLERFGGLDLETAYLNALDHAQASPAPP